MGKKMKHELAQFSKELALLAGDILRQGFGQTLEISNKEGKNNLVTNYDLKAEKAIIDAIHEKYPEHVVLAEESGMTGFNPETVRWIIDPLDGTVNFAHNVPIFSVSVAAEYQGEILAGVIYNPITEEFFSAVKGEGAYFNGKKVSVSETNNMETSFLVTGFPYNVNENPCNCVDILVKIISQGISVRRLGSAALDLAYVACGRFDAFWEVELRPWDVAAGILLVREAGGAVTTFDNKEYKIGDQSLIASNVHLHKDIYQTLKNCGRIINNGC